MSVGYLSISGVETYVVTLYIDPTLERYFFFNKTQAADQSRSRANHIPFLYEIALRLLTPFALSSSSLLPLTVTLHPSNLRWISQIKDMSDVVVDRHPTGWVRFPSNQMSTSPNLPYS